MSFPLPKDLSHTLKYLRTLLSSKSPEDWRLLQIKISSLQTIHLSIAQRWRDIFAHTWNNLLYGPSPLAVSRASRQPTITEALGNIPPCTSQTTDRLGPRIALHFPTKRKNGPGRKPTSTRKPSPTVKPLRGSDAPGENASIIKVLSRAKPRRIKHNRRFTCVEEFLVHLGPKICTLDEAQEQYTMGFNIEAITSLNDGVPSEDLQPFVSMKRLTTQQRRKYKVPPPTTMCLVQFAPSP